MTRWPSYALRNALVVPIGILLMTLGGCGDTALETTPPTITAAAPQDGVTGVDPSSVIAVTFSERMNKASVEATFSSVPALPAGSFSWAGNTLTFTPDIGLDASTDYVITVGTGATDLAGNPLAGANSVRWRTGLPYTAIDLQSDFAVPTSNGGVTPTADGRYLFWHDGTNGEGGGCDIHLYRVGISDLLSRTIWTNRSIWGIYDDGVSTWVGNYYPSTGAKVPGSDPLSYIVRGIFYHTIALNGNRPDFPYVYFGTSGGEGIGYWKRSDDTTGVIPGSAAWVYQSAVIGDRIYFPRGHVSSPGIMVVDAAANPTVLEGTLLPGEPRIAGASEIISDNVYLYVVNGTTMEIHKIDPSGTGSIVDTYSPGVLLTNPVSQGSFIYSGVNGDNNVYILDKATGNTVKKDCSPYLPTAVGSPRWDSYNDGIWFGPRQGVLTDVRKAYFIPRRIIDALPAS